MTTLLFVYNAHSGTLNALLDSAHKLLSPKTYQCNLCALTYGSFSENIQWKQFRENGMFNMKFYHIDEFENEFPNSSYKYPVILKQNENKLEVLLSKEKLKSITSVDKLIHYLKQVQDDNISK